MSRISNKVKEVADNHIRARMEDRFDDIPVSGLDELKRNVLDGKTYSSLMDAIEIKYSTITSTLTARQFKHATDSYRSAIYKGFKVLFNK